MTSILRSTSFSRGGGLGGLANSLDGILAGSLAGSLAGGLVGSLAGGLADSLAIFNEADMMNGVRVEQFSVMYFFLKIRVAPLM